MKTVWMSITCLAALLAGAVIGRQTVAGPSGPSGSEVPPGRAGKAAAATTAAAPDLPSAFKAAATQRGKMLIMLNALEARSSRNMPQLVDAMSNDYYQLSMLADLAIHTNPAGFMKALIHRKPGEDAVGYMAWNFAERWGKIDFPGAFETCLNFPQPSGGFLAGTVLQTRFADDPTEALKTAAQHPELRFAWSNSFNIPATSVNLDLIRALPPSMGKAAMIEAISKNLEPDAAYALVLQDRSFNSGYGLPKASKSLVEKDPEAAREWILSHQGHPATSQFAYAYGDHLLRKDPAAAAEWAASQLSGSRRTSILEKAAKELESKDPAAAEGVRALLPSAIKSADKP